MDPDYSFQEGMYTIIIVPSFWIDNTTEILIPTECSICMKFGRQIVTEKHNYCTG